MLDQTLMAPNIHPEVIWYAQNWVESCRLDFRVCSRIPNPRPERLIQIRHMNSSEIPPIHCSASFMIAVQSLKRVEASEVASRLCATLANMSKLTIGKIYIHRSEIINTPYFMDNPELDMVQQYIFGIRYIMPLQII